LAPNGLKFIEFQGKYAGQEHIIEADIIEKFTIDKSQVVGMIRKSRKSIITNSDSKEVLPHYNRKDLHFFHQAYLPVKEFRNIAPFFMDWLNDEIHKKNN